MNNLSKALNNTLNSVPTGKEPTPTVVYTLVTEIENSFNEFQSQFEKIVSDIKTQPATSFNDKMILVNALFDLATQYTKLRKISVQVLILQHFKSNLDHVNTHVQNPIDDFLTNVAESEGTWQQTAYISATLAQPIVELNNSLQESYKRLQNEFFELQNKPITAKVNKMDKALDLKKHHKVVKSVIDNIKVDSPFITSRDKIASLLIAIFGIKKSELTQITVMDLKRIKAIKAGESFQFERLQNKYNQPRVFSLTEIEVEFLTNYEQDFVLLFANPDYKDDQLFMNLSKEHLSRRFNRYFAPLKNQNLDATQTAIENNQGNEQKMNHQIV